MNNTQQSSNSKKQKNYIHTGTKGHSIIKHICFGWMALWIPAIYYTISPNHYWHA